MKRETRRLTSAQVRAFRKKIYGHYKEHGRNLPWRATSDPYHILVSEIMLQQTQVQRVLEKYEPFITNFPDWGSLANAPLRDILRVWHGLGYNRRALALKKTAQTVVTDFDSELPSDPKTLATLPGIGKATAGAICAFAYNLPTAFVETNIRTVFIHFFFRDRDRVSDTEILQLVKQNIDTADPRTWYYALMDYGVMLKQTHRDLNSRSAHYKRQAPFKGSNRQLRGTILRLLTEEGRISQTQVARRLKTDPQRTSACLKQLQAEGFIKKRGRVYTITQ
jgi:A/G-specific adenine glycosylase